MGSHSTVWFIVGLAGATFGISEIRSSLQSGEVRWFSARFDRATSTGEFWFAIAYHGVAVLGGLVIAGLALFL